MSQLSELQQELAAAIRDGAEPQEGLLAGDWVQGLEVYRHAYGARLLSALRDNYVVLARAMGDEAFDALGRAFILTNPSRKPSIRWFGDGLADFMALQGQDLVAHEALVDLARMDWALRGAFDAADAPVLMAEQLAALAAQDWTGLRVLLHPSVRRVSLAHAIEPAWLALRDWLPESDLPQPELQPPPMLAHELLAWRCRGETRWRSLEPLESALLDAVAAQEPFPELCRRAAELQPAVHDVVPVVVALLQRWLVDGMLAS